MRHGMGWAALVAAVLGGGAPGAAQAPIGVEQATEMLQAGNREQVELGIQSLGLNGTKQAVEPLAERIRAGLPPDLLELAIATLTALGHPSAGPVLIELTNHRRPDVRLQAVDALSTLAPSGAPGALTAALSDSDAAVRARAAKGLGDVGARQSVDVLFVALDRGVFEASRSIGKLVPASEATKLLDYLGKIPLRALGPALQEVLKREEVGLRDKLRIVARLQEVATREARGHIQDFLAQAQSDIPGRLKRAAVEAIETMPE